MKLLDVFPPFCWFRQIDENLMEYEWRREGW